VQGLEPNSTDPPAREQSPMLVTALNPHRHERSAAIALTAPGSLRCAGRHCLPDT
jgi:hypothetical protein